MLGIANHYAPVCTCRNQRNDEDNGQQNYRKEGEFRVLSQVTLETWGWVRKTL